MGPAYTWTNKRMQPFNIKERLDRVLVDSSWRSTFPNSVVSHLPAIGSNHCPILFNSESKKFKRKFIFRFEQIWTKNDQYFSFMDSTWTNMNGNIISKLSGFQKKILVWKKKMIPNWKLEIPEITNKIEAIQNLNSSSDDSILQEKNLYSTNCTIFNP